MNAILFAGPTISPEEIRAVVDATVLPPARQGDVYRAALARPDAIGLIDGYFDRVPAVWHKEILWAMSQGIYVFGAASMGALRAAELAPFGMIGVGEVFRAFHLGELRDDDEVALVHGPAEVGYCPLSEPMVNVRATIRRARSHGILEDAPADTILREAKRLHYPDRTYSTILACAEEAGVPSAQIHSLQAWIPSEAVDQKRRDALDMCRAIRHWFDGERGAMRPRFTLARTDAWENACRQADGQATTGAACSEAERVLEELAMGGGYGAASWAALARNLSGRLLDADVSEYVPTGLEDLLAERGFRTSAEVEGWLDEQDVQRAGVRGVLGRHGQVVRMREIVGRALRRDIVEHLQTEGRYRRLRDRAREKDRLLSKLAVDEGAVSGSGEMLAWFAKTVLGETVRCEPIELATRLGFVDLPSFQRAVVREYLFRRGCRADSSR